MHRGARFALVLLFATSVQACASDGPRGHGEVRFDAAVRPSGTDAFPNWSVPPEEAEQLIAFADAELVTFKRTAQGLGGAERAEVHFPSVGRTFWLKAKRMPEDLDGVNNAPRKELAAYAVQRLFLDPEDYVVPTSVSRCVRLDAYRTQHPRASSTLEGTRCVLVLVSLWLQDVRVPETLYDNELFLTDPGYAYFMSNFNLLTYLMDHRDGREGNFLVANDDVRRQVFSVDNGVSFDPSFPNYNWFVPNWNDLRVPALRRESIERLRKLEEKDLDFLLVVEQLQMDEERILRQVPTTAPIDPDEGVSVQDGVVQLGLTEDEIEDIWERIEELLEDVDDGDIPLF